VLAVLPRTAAPRAAVGAGEGLPPAHGWFLFAIGSLVLAGLLWAFVHHFCAGIRFLLLDLHVGIEKEAARKSAAVVFAVSIPLALILWGVLL